MTSSDVDIAKSRDRRDANDPESAKTAATLAFRSDQFLESDEGRPIRILSEYLAPLGAFMRAGVKHTVVFFGSARLAESGPLGR